MKNRLYSFSISAAVLMSSEPSGAKNWKKIALFACKKMIDKNNDHTNFYKYVHKLSTSLTLLDRIAYILSRGPSLLNQLLKNALPIS